MGSLIWNAGGQGPGKRPNILKVTGLALNQELFSLRCHRCYFAKVYYSQSAPHIWWKDGPAAWATAVRFTRVSPFCVGPCGVTRPVLSSSQRGASFPSQKMVLFTIWSAGLGSPEGCMSKWEVWGLQISPRQNNSQAQQPLQKPQSLKWLSPKQMGIKVKCQPNRH